MKSPKNESRPALPEDIEAATRCFEAYGADISKWPSDMRDRYGALAKRDELAPARNDAKTLDACLDVPAPAADRSLKAELLQQYDETRLRRAALIDWSDLFRATRRQFQIVPAGALAALGALGVAAGAISPGFQQAPSPEEELYAYFDDALALTLSDEEEALLWDAE